MNTYEILVSSLSVLVTALIGWNIFAVIDFQRKVSFLEEKTKDIAKQLSERSAMYANCYGLFSNATTMIRDGHPERGIPALFAVLESVNKVEWPESVNPRRPIVDILLQHLRGDAEIERFIPTRDLKHFEVILRDTAMTEAMELADRLACM